MGAFLDCYILHVIFFYFPFLFFSLFFFLFFSFLFFSPVRLSLSLFLSLSLPHPLSLSLIFVPNRTGFEPKSDFKEFSTSREGFKVRLLKEPLLNLCFSDFKTYFGSKRILMIFE